MKLDLKKPYESKLSVIETQKAIKDLKDYFERALAEELNLMRVSAPLFVKASTGLNDNLNGVERPIAFETKDGEEVQIVHSLAKWKRNALKRYKFKPYTGLYTDMNAIRRDEDLSQFHSLYVDQWDWEMIIEDEDRTDEFLESIVKRIYGVFKRTETYINGLYSVLDKKLPEDITFLTSEELREKDPSLTPKEREHKAAREYKAIFIKQIGKELGDGTRHDGRAPDYDDWQLNGDIIFYHPVLDCALELSSMGIRVDKTRLLVQLEYADAMERLELPYHKNIINEVLPLTVGGGIGQSRLCLFFLEKAHIGEVQASVWPKDMEEECAKLNIPLL
ncbi:MAG: aspartate--ammonia ligase [Bacilli bacterium]|nr:aspartate--ammonia ligase [Bacilli bacterium]